MVSQRWSAPSLEGTYLTTFTNEEEFLAVLVTNIYISDPSNVTKSGLRAAHLGGKALGAPFTKPFGMFSRGPQVFTLINNLLNDNRGFGRGVAALRDIPFNPLAEMVKDRTRALAAFMHGMTPQGIREIAMELARAI
jgi:hypothetical protein